MVEAASVLVDQSKLDTVHVVVIVLTVLLPAKQVSIKDVTVLEIALAKGMILCLCCHLLC